MGCIISCGNWEGKRSVDIQNEYDYFGLKWNVLSSLT